ncbi:DsbA family protein [Actinomadura kijaniata]|uniref:DSBA-like thioredoxin domain-containing protein n=1 Tax=Actinomadura namibiensis TaxID=182080 RepID=A0A7W3LTG9_ACTNM|nr:DsbA family protein [Actinomadura namibiensis]MBA8953975.1 hypothetical protein [Actinomadura namibiensis]
MAPTTVDLWFDPICPWTWLTSRWLTEVERIRDVQVNWHVMSLPILNEGRLDQVPERFREMMGPKGWRPVRVLSAVADRHGNAAVGRLYTAMGTRQHLNGEDVTPDFIAGSLKDADLPADLAAVADTTTYDEAVRASHQRAQEAFGQETGTPVLAVTGADGGPVVFNGPVLTPAPTGEEAGRLWDAAVLLAAAPGFYEIRRARPDGPDLG